MANEPEAIGAMPYHFPTKAINPYRISKLDIPVAVGAAAFAGAGHYIQSRVRPFSLSQLNAQDPSAIPRFDRLNVGNWRPSAAALSDVVALCAVVSPVTLFTRTNRSHIYPHILLMGAEAALISYGFTTTAKGLAHRTRPYAYGQVAPLSERLDRDARLSFFSGHTCLVATATFFAAQVTVDLNPKSNLQVLIWSAAALAPAAVGYLRVRSGKHFPSDVVAGYAVGAASGILVPLLHHRRPSKAEVSLSPTFWGSGSGVAFCWRW